MFALVAAMLPGEEAGLAAAGLQRQDAVSKVELTDVYDISYGNHPLFYPIFNTFDSKILCNWGNHI